MDGEEAIDVDTEAVVERRATVGEREHAGGVQVEGRARSRAGHHIGPAGVLILDDATVDGERAPRAFGILGGVQGQLAGADLLELGVGRVVEADESTREGRAGIIESEREGRRSA